MSDKPRTVSFVRKFRQQLRSFVDGGIRKRFVVCMVGLVTIATGSAIADVYLRNLFPFLDFTGFSGTYSNTGSVDLSGHSSRASAPMVEPVELAMHPVTHSD